MKSIGVDSRQSCGLFCMKSDTAELRSVLHEVRQTEKWRAESFLKFRVGTLYLLMCGSWEWLKPEDEVSQKVGNGVSENPWES